MKYRHYKGTTYMFMCEAIHTETGQHMVVYRDAKDLKKVYTRPALMFYGDVSPGVKRFEAIELRVCLLAVTKSKTNYIREVWMTRTDLEELKRTWNVTPYLEVPASRIVPAGDWDYIFAFNAEAP